MKGSANGVAAGSASRTWLIGGVVGAVLLAALTWLLAVAPTRSDAQGLRDDTVAVQAQNASLGSKNAALKQQADRRAGLVAEARGALAALPTAIDLPGFNSELAGHAAARGVSVASISVGAATAAPSTDESGAPVASGVLSVPITVQTMGPALAQLYFLRDVQEAGPRAVLVTSTALSADGSEATADPNNMPDPSKPDAMATTLTTEMTVFASALSVQDSKLLSEALGTDITAIAN